MFFKHFTSKNQLPGLSIGLTWVENGLSKLIENSGTLESKIIVIRNRQSGNTDRNGRSTHLC